MRAQIQNRRQDLTTKLFMMVISVALFSWLWGFWLALGVLGMIFVHETGHLHAAKFSGLYTKGFYFLPGLGGIAIIEPPSNRLEDCFISLAGPIYGFIYSAAFGILFLITDVPIIGSITIWCAIINLFNLLPIYPLDGGRIAKAIGYSIHKNLGIFITYAGIAFGALMLFRGILVLGFVAVIGFLEHRRFGYKEEMKPKMTWAQIGLYVIASLVVIAALSGVLIAVS